MNLMKIKMNLIRKISIGRDYKNDAMHYSIGQEVFGGHTISEILEEEEGYVIYIKKMTKYCHGNILIKTWLYQLNLIYNINETYSRLYCTTNRRQI
jgi:hypothetical protein